MGLRYVTRYVMRSDHAPEGRLHHLFYITKLFLQATILMAKALYKRWKAKNTFQRTPVTSGISQ